MKTVKLYVKAHDLLSDQALSLTDVVCSYY